MIAVTLIFLTCICISFTFNVRISKKFSSGFQKLPLSTKEDGYGPIGSLLRQGPVPFFIRITNPDTYEAAVKKYQALEKCDRVTAQSNMDAYFQDPNGWAANKIKARKTGVDIDYTNANMDTKSLVLTAIWAIGFFTLCYRIFVVQVLHA